MKAAMNTVPSDDVFPVVYDNLRALARRYLSRERRDHTWQPTALVHEAWFRLREQRRVSWNGPTHVVAVGALAMRRLLMDHGRGRKREKRCGRDRVTLHHDHIHDRPRVCREDALALRILLKRLAALDSRQASIVEMRFFDGLTVEEVAQALGVSERTVEGEWTHARAWLRQQLSKIDRHG